MFPIYIAICIILRVTFSVQFSLSREGLFVTPWTAAHQASLTITISQSLLKLMSIESVMPPNHLILCCPLIRLPSIFPSIRVFSSESAVSISGQIIGASASESILLMTIQGWFPLGLTDLISLLSKRLSSLLQHHNSKASVLQSSALFMVQLSHPYLTTGKIIALTIQIFVNKVMSLHLNTLSRFVTALLPRSKHLLISWLQSPSAVILEPKKRKSVTISIVSPSICHEVMARLYVIILVFWCWVLNQLFHCPLSLSRGSLVLLCILP